MVSARRSGSSDKKLKEMLAQIIMDTQGKTKCVRGRQWTTVIATGYERIGGAKRTNRRILVPASMFPCAIEEKLIIKMVDGKKVERYETKVADNEGFITKYPGECPQFLEDGRVILVEPQESNSSAERGEEEDRNLKSGFASRPLPQYEGNRNGWISAEEEGEGEYEVDSDLESTATSRFNPCWSEK